MFSAVHLFNPDYDMAMANFTSYYKSPSEIVRMASDLSSLPWWFAEKGYGVKVPDEKLLPRLQSQLIALCRENKEGEKILDELLPRVGWTTDWLSLPYVPWGWTPALVHQLKQEGVDCKFLPSEESLRRIRFLSSRQRCLEVLPMLNKLKGVCGEMKACVELGEVEQFIRMKGQAVLKAPWSGSGRGLLKVSSASWNTQLEGWAARILRVQGVLMAEPIYDKVADFAMEFYLKGNSDIHFAGYSLFETDVHGNYKANCLMSNEHIEQLLNNYVSKELLHEVRMCLEENLSVLLGRDYQGYLGVDMMVCRAGNGHLLHPCVEINLRMNMGVVSRILYDKYVYPLSGGSYIVEHYMHDGEALFAHQSLSANFPLKLKEKRISHGYFPLTPVSEDTRFQAYLLVKE